MSVEIRRASDRFVSRGPGREARHSFSFGEHFDPDRLRFGPMVCHDDHILAAGSGYELHPHSGLVIVSWVLTGSVEHRDSTDAPATVVQPGMVQVLHTGAGITHSEIAASPQTRFVQVWLTPDEDASDDPSYAVTQVDVPAGQLVEVTRPTRTAVLSVARLETGQSVTLPEDPLQHVFVGRGALTRSSMAEPLEAGDAFLITDDPALQVTAAVPTELLVWGFTPVPSLVE